MSCRSGLRVRCEKGINTNVKEACLDFAEWLRLNMEFPIRVVVYIKKNYQIKTIDGKEWVSATFFAPYDKRVEPYIRVATGDYEELVEERGTENAIYAILNSMAHELVHYRQWLDDRELDEGEAEIEGSKLVDNYYEGSVFFEEVVQQKKVWTITNDEWVATANNDEGETLMPFWSAKARAEQIIKLVPAYHKFRVQEITLDDFLNIWINGLKKDNRLVGINWCGKRLIGHEMDPNEIFERIHEQIKSVNELG
ncbi:hypothetical protein J27TS8_04700 [Robertmurraya siralis]|uniref:Uncharacterized protein n=1 Tax=Robertmurraya siralis TaxID=77777 RepID=A0A919WET3_9BACI|nr:DUF2750 domain-containing protein [Robertmurraya siralis]GIN60477.1 hypothetical protein J27TS8_04700 [Robertmurraya siralis]